MVYHIEPDTELNHLFIQTLYSMNQLFDRNIFDNYETEIEISETSALFLFFNLSIACSGVHIIFFSYLGCNFSPRLSGFRYLNR